MAHMAAMACMWSGVETVTASMLFSLSSISRKSLYRLAFGYSSKVLAARTQSGSAKATMFSPAQAAMGIVAGGLLGLAGSALAVGRHLRSV